MNIKSIARLALLSAIASGSAGVWAKSDASNSGPLLVWDADGNPVGHLNGEKVIVHIAGKTVQLGLKERTEGRAGLEWDDSLDPLSYILFDSADCTGVAYLPTSERHPRPFGTSPAVLSKQGSEYEVYVGQSLKVQSLPGPWHATISAGGVCSAEDIAGPQDVWVLNPPIDIKSRFALPFRVK